MSKEVASVTRVNAGGTLDVSMHSSGVIITVTASDNMFVKGETVVVRDGTAYHRINS